jgi:BON domain
MKPSRRTTTILLSAACGVALAYFMDPDAGRGRRTRARDRIGAFLRRGGRTAARLSRRTEAEAYGVGQKAIHRHPETTEFDDVTLARKVETEIFGDPEVAKGRINLNVEEGTVVLRGKVDSPEQLSQLEKRARKIVGVRDVRNLLRVDGGSGSNKVDAKPAGSSRERGQAR